MQQARSLDPLSLIVAVTVSRHGYCFARRSSSAIKELQDIVRTDPDFWMTGRRFLGFAYLANDQTSEALELLKMPATSSRTAISSRE